MQMLLVLFALPSSHSPSPLHGHRSLQSQMFTSPTLVGRIVSGLVGLLVGFTVGFLVGSGVGSVGEEEGLGVVGDLVGRSVVGDLVGLAVGVLLGRLVGGSVGPLVGLVGLPVGCSVVGAVGDAVGCDVGAWLGDVVGDTELGLGVGLLGLRVGGLRADLALAPSSRPPQSAQSVPRPHSEVTDPRPPS